MRKSSQPRTTTQRSGLQATVPFYLTEVSVDEDGFITDFEVAYLPDDADPEEIKRALRDALNLDEPPRCEVYDADDRYLAGHPGTPTAPGIVARLRRAPVRALPAPPPRQERNQPMIPSDLDDRYRYDGESIEVDRPLNAAQYVSCFAALGWGSDHPAYDASKASYELAPDSPSEANALRAHLREQAIPHSTEVRHSWAPNEREARKARELVDLLRLAERLQLKEGALDEALYDGEAPCASQINNQGAEAQLRWLLGVNDTETVRNLIEDAARCEN
jgi:hypothetical protein